jgi:hypothetical protein
MVPQPVLPVPIVRILSRNPRKIDAFELMLFQQYRHRTLQKLDPLVEVSNIEQPVCKIVSINLPLGHVPTL